jgi:hypothetical protein
MGGYTDTVLFSVQRSHTEKTGTRRRNGCTAEEQEESVDSEDGHDAWFGEKSCADCLELDFVRRPIRE